MEILAGLVPKGFAVFPSGVGKGASADFVLAVGFLVGGSVQENGGPRDETPCAFVA